MWLTIGLLLKGPVGQTDTVAQALHHIVWEGNHFPRDMCFWWTSSYVRTKEEKIDHATQPHSWQHSIRSGTDQSGPRQARCNGAMILSFSALSYGFLPVVMSGQSDAMAGDSDQKAAALELILTESMTPRVCVLCHFSWKRLSLIDNGRRWFG